jgi:hypothetical protein
VPRLREPATGGIIAVDGFKDSLDRFLAAVVVRVAREADCDLDGVREAVEAKGGLREMVSDAVEELVGRFEG